MFKLVELYLLEIKISCSWGSIGPFWLSPPKIGPLSG
jgi:hypothetical protein